MPTLIRHLKSSMLHAILFVCFYGLEASSQQMKVLRTFPIKSTGGWDYITVNPPTNRLYVSHGSQVNILDLVSGDSVGVVQHTSGVHGIAIVNKYGKGYTSNGRDNSSTVFDLKTNKELKKIKCGENPDAIFFDDFSSKVFVFNGRSKDATVIDPQSDAVVATIPLGSKPETGVSNGGGKIFVNAESTNEVLVIDARTYKVTARYSVTGGEEPSGLDIDRKTNRLFIGCGGNKTMVVMDASSGAVVAKFPIGSCDGLVFDPATQCAYSSNSEGNVSVVRENSPESFEQLASITTERSARTITIDVIKHKLYLPAAKLLPASGDERPKAVPGSFHVLELGAN